MRLHEGLAKSRSNNFRAETLIINFNLRCSYQTVSAPPLLNKLAMVKLKDKITSNLHNPNKPSPLIGLTSCLLRSAVNNVMGGSRTQRHASLLLATKKDIHSSRSSTRQTSQSHYEVSFNVEVSVSALVSWCELVCRHAQQLTKQGIES